MSTSGSTNFSTSRNELIAGALRIIGAVAQGETPTTAQYSEGSEALNMLCKAWMADGMPLWVTREYTMPLTASTASYTPSLKMMKVIQAYNHNTTTNVDIPMRIITRDEYNRLGNKTSAGNPIQLMHIPNRTDSTIKVYPVPGTTEQTYNQIIITYQKQYDDLDTSTDEPEFPSEWFDALKFGLAHRLAPEYGMEINDRRQLQQEALLLKQEALNNGLENGSFFFQADMRTW